MVTLCLYRFLQANEQLWDLFDPLEDYGSVAVASIFTSKRTTLESGLTVTSSRTMVTLRLYRCLQAIGQLWDEFDLLKDPKEGGGKKARTWGHAPLPRKRYLNETQILRGRLSEEPRDKCEFKRDPSHHLSPVYKSPCRLFNTSQKGPESATDGTCIFIYFHWFQ